MAKVNLDALVLFDNVRTDKIINDGVKIFNEFLYGEYISNMEADYYEVQRSLLAASESEEIEGSYWQNYVCRLLAESENRFSLLSEKGGADEKMKRLAAKEMGEMRKLYEMDWSKIAEVFHDSSTSVCCMHANAPEGLFNGRDRLRKVFMEQDDRRAADQLDQFYQSCGCGYYEKYKAFIWKDGLKGIEHYDRTSFDQLVGYERQKQSLIENTEFFLNGMPSNNVLLYGDKGTGKSTSVKALLNRFKDRKLKIISLSKEDITSLYRILEEISARGCYFILFIDDLSFEDTEIEYKYFKSVIDGGITAQPANTLIYVTSNRRNLIKETWKDRQGDNSEVHSSDGMQERLSLVDRFGLSLTFSSPDKEEYLQIVRELAKKEKLDIGESELIEEAERWEMRYHGRSGRSARQFVNHIAAKKKLQ